MTGWSTRPAPTPGRSATARCRGRAARPWARCPSACRIAGEPIAPAARVIRRPRTCSALVIGPPISTPTARSPLEEDPVDQAVRPDGEVGPLPGGQQVADRGGQPQAAPPVLREGADAGRLRVVVVGDLGEAQAAADLEEGALGRDQLIAPPAADRDRAAAPVQLADPVRVVLQPTKVRQHLRPAPLVVAQRRPLVVVGRHATQGDRGVDGRGAADHPATRIGNGPARHGLCGQPPVVCLQRHPPAVLQVGRGRLEGRVVRAGLQQQDAAGRFLRQPRREHRASRTATHNDVVVLHGPRVLLALDIRTANRPAPGLALRDARHPRKESVCNRSGRRRTNKSRPIRAPGLRPLSSAVAVVDGCGRRARTSSRLLRKGVRKLRNLTGGRSVAIRPLWRESRPTCLRP